MRGAAAATALEHLAMADAHATRAVDGAASEPVKIISVVRRRAIDAAVGEEGREGTAVSKVMRAERV